MSRLLTNKWTAVALLAVVATIVGVHEWSAQPTLTLAYTAPEGEETLFARLAGRDRDALLFATLQHVARMHPEDRARWISGRAMRVLPAGGVEVRDTPAMHERFRVYLSSLTGRGAVRIVRDLPADRRVTLRLQLVDAGSSHREILNQDASAEQVCREITRSVLARGDGLTRYPGTGAAEITTTAGQVVRIGPLLDGIKWAPPPYPTLARLYDATNTAFYFESAREHVEPASRFWRVSEYPTLCAVLDGSRPLTLSQRVAVWTFLGTWGKAHFALLSGGLLADFQYQTLSDRDPFNAWNPPPLAEHFARLLWMRAVLDASAGKPLEGAGAAAMAIAWADRLERGESPYFLCTPEVRMIGCRAYADMLHSALQPFTAQQWRDLFGLFALRMAPYEKPWPADRFFPADTADPLERWVNGWRHRQEELYWKRWRMSETAVDLLRLVVALNLYRTEHVEFPASLEGLVPAVLPAVPLDTLNQRDFVYSSNGLSFKLYSVGYDGKDDGESTLCDPDDPSSLGDFWWEDATP